MRKQLINTQFDSSSLAYSFSPSCLRLVKTCHILGCLEGVWEASGVCLSKLLILSGGTMCKHLFHSFSPAGSFSLLYENYTKCAIFWGVRRVSGGCLGGVWGLSN